MSDGIPLGDLIYDVLHAIALNDDVETLEAALALSKAAQKKIEDRSLEGSPSIAPKLQRLRKRLKSDLGAKGYDPEPTRVKSKSPGAGLGELDWTPEEED